MEVIDLSAWVEFTVGDLFEIKPTKAYTLTNAYLMSEYGENPVVVNSQYNNGIGGYSDQLNTEKGNIITFSDTTTSESIFYQPDDFIGYPHVQGMYPIGKYADSWTKTSMLFFATIFKTHANLMNYSYSNKFTRVQASEMKIKLPVNDNNHPDFEYMERYISERLEDVDSLLDVLF